MTFENCSIPCSSRSDYFADFFLKKVQSITSDTSDVKADPLVFNGTKKVDADDQMFMNLHDVKKCIMEIKNKFNLGDGEMYQESP